MFTLQVLASAKYPGPDIEANRVSFRLTKKKTPIDFNAVPILSPHPPYDPESLKVTSGINLQ